MNTDELYPDIIGSIYEAAYEAAGEFTLWPRALQKIADITRASAISLPLFERLGSPTLGLIATVNLDADFHKQHSKYAHLNPYFIRGSNQFSELKPIAGEMIMPEREFLETAYYNDFLRRFDLCYHCGGAVFREQSLVAILRINRPRRGAPFAERELALLRPLMPHIKRALQFHRFRAAIEAQGHGLLAGVDALPTGFILVDARGKILFMNPSARATLSQNDGLSASNQTLRSMRSSESEKLRQIVSAAGRTGASDGAQPGGVISISRPSLRRPYSILISPLRLTCNPFPGVQVPAAAIFISDPEARPQPEQHVLQELYSLTPAECRLATALLRGNTLPQVTDLLGISRNTAHSQLGAIFEKTRTHRQAELVVLLSSTLVHAKVRADERRSRAA